MPKNTIQISAEHTELLRHDAAKNRRSMAAQLATLLDATYAQVAAPAPEAPPAMVFGSLRGLRKGL